MNGRLSAHIVLQTLQVSFVGSARLKLLVVLLLSLLVVGTVEAIIAKLELFTLEH